MLSIFRHTIICLTVAVSVQSCYRVLPSNGGGQIDYNPIRQIDESDILLPAGYIIEAVASNLTFPTAAALDENDNLYVIESGYSYGEIFLTPRLLMITDDGEAVEILKGENNGPWNGLLFDDGNLFIAEGGQLKGGRILKYNISNKELTVLVDGLPSFGDHHTNNMVIKDNYLYFGQGTATNSAVVGNDNAEFGWLYRYEDFHDIPCRDIKVHDRRYITPNVLTKDPDDKAITGPFSPYNNTVDEGDVIPGTIPCNGAVMRVPLEGGDLELVGWGFRNPFGIAINSTNKIFVTDNYYDVRGSRPVWGTGDLLWELENDKWYGWPDYYSGIPLSEIKVPGESDPESILVENPNKPPKAVAKLGVHSSSNGMAFSQSSNFGFEDQAFIAQFGDMSPGVGKVLSPVGYKIIRVDTKTGIIEDFAANAGKKNGPASFLKNGGLERPISVTFSTNGSALYIVDFGIVKTGGDEGVVPLKQSGVIWKVSKN